MSTRTLLCDACDGCGWTEGGTDFAIGQICAKCGGAGAAPADVMDPARLAEWDAAVNPQGPQ